MNKLNIKALAVAGGILWGLYMLFIGWSAWLLGWGTDLVATISSLYIGFEPTFVGGIIGAIWGLVDGAIAGGIIAWVYNVATGKP